MSNATYQILDKTSLHLALQKLQSLRIHNCIIFQPEITIIANRTPLLTEMFEEKFSYFHTHGFHYVHLDTNIVNPLNRATIIRNHHIFHVLAIIIVGDLLIIKTIRG